MLLFALLIDVNCISSPLSSLNNDNKVELPIKNVCQHLKEKPELLLKPCSMYENKSYDVA